MNTDSNGSRQPAGGASDPAVLQAAIGYLAPMSSRPAFHARDTSRDNLQLAPRPMLIEDLRGSDEGLSLDNQGFVLIDQPTAADLHDPARLAQGYLPEVAERLRQLTGAATVVTIPRGVWRYGERSDRHGTGVNTRPARFAHVDYTPRSAPGLLQPLLDAAGLVRRRGQRVAGYNVWRVLTPPPQDVPLAVCDASTVAAHDLVEADAVFDPPDAAHFSFEAWLLRHNPAHRWCWFSAMNRHEALVFKSYDSAPEHAPGVPHCAFDPPACPPGTPARASLEVRAFALFD